MKNGIENLNARNFANYINVSTQPIFRHYQNIQALKEDIYKTAKKGYLEYVITNMDEKEYLLTMLYFIIMYAKYNSNIYKMIFYSDFAGSRTLDEINSSIWNDKAINIIMKEYSKTKEECKRIYRDLRFYTHGIAIQLASKTVIIDDKEIKTLLKNVINKLLS